MSPETARYYNVLGRKLRDDKRALEREFTKRVARMFGAPTKQRPTERKS